MDEYISEQTFKENRMAEYIDRNLCEIVAEYDQYYKLVVPLEKIRKMPAADVVEVRRGRWKNGGNGLYDTCTACGEEIYLAIPMNYCPLCGARMDKEDEHEAD